MLRRVRPSNLVILFALPFILYLFVANGDYTRSLAAIVGVEPGARRLVPGFLAVTLAFSAGLAVLRWPRWRWGFGAVWLAATAMVLAGLAQPFASSVLANAVDGFTSDLVVRGETPRRLTEAAEGALAVWLWRAALAYAAVNLVGFAAWPRPLARWLLGGVNGIGLGFILLFAHFGFAAGVATTLRAAILAYGLALVLGLCWIGLLQLRVVRRTWPLFGGVILLLLALAFWQYSQPKQGFALVGDLSGKIAVTPGTPQSLIDAARYGTFPGGADIERPLLTLKDPAAALAALGAQASAALVPAALAKAPIWTVETLPDGNTTAATGAVVLAIVLGLLTLGGWVHGRHPMSVGAEFLVDTIRGIPMLVIVLYIGLPLAGAVKAGTGGFIDPPNLLRGIVAMALAYSAYLAEIFRAGLNAVPTGQLEAARSMGLSRWQTARHVLIPQAFRIVIPPLGNEFIAILKDTSLLSILSIRDVTQRMREFQSASFLPFAPYNSAAIFYLLLTLVAASLIASIERKFHVKR
jgi:polar amino acid transport system permease protein